VLAEVIGAEAAQHLPQRDAEHLPDQEPREHGLPPLVRHGVADPGQRQRNERARGGTAQHAREDERTERRREDAQRSDEMAQTGGTPA
jgi:hypothetical protein